MTSAKYETATSVNIAVSPVIKMLDKAECDHHSVYHLLSPSPVFVRKEGEREKSPDEPDFSRLYELRFPAQFLLIITNQIPFHSSCSTSSPPCAPPATSCPIRLTYVLLNTSAASSPLTAWARTTRATRPRTAPARNGSAATTPVTRALLRRSRLDLCFSLLSYFAHFFILQ